MSKKNRSKARAETNPEVEVQEVHEAAPQGESEMQPPTEPIVATEEVVEAAPAEPMATEPAAEAPAEAAHELVEPSTAPEATAVDAPATEQPTIATPSEETPAQQERTPKAEKPKKMSALDAAAVVLAGRGEPMTAPELIEAMATSGLWDSPNGKTPAATLYAAMLREITTKGVASRFTRPERGKFGLKAS
jgi:hypothetical protein